MIDKGMTLSKMIDVVVDNSLFTLLWSPEDGEFTTLHQLVPLL